MPYRTGELQITNIWAQFVQGPANNGVHRLRRNVQCVIPRTLLPTAARIKPGKQLASQTSTGFRIIARFIPRVQSRRRGLVLYL